MAIALEKQPVLLNLNEKEGSASSKKSATPLFGTAFPFSETPSSAKPVEKLEVEKPILFELPFLKVIFDAQGINDEWAAIQQEKLEADKNKVEAEYKPVSLKDHDDTLKYGQHIASEVASHFPGRWPLGEPVEPSAKWRGDIKATHERLVEQNYVIKDEAREEFITTFQKRMAIRMGDKTSEVRFQGLPIVVPYADQRVKGSWVERLQTAIRQADREEIQPSDVYELIDDIAPQVMQLQIKQISQACSTNPTAENIRNLRTLLKNDDYLKVMTNDLVSQLTQPETAKVPAVLELFGHQQGSDTLARLQETFSVIKDGAVVEKKTALSNVLDIITFENFSAKDVPAFRAQYLYLKAINLTEKTRSFNLEKMWTQEMMRRLGELLIILFQDFAKFDMNSPSYDQQVVHHERLHDLTFFTIGQAVEVVNSQLFDTSNCISADQVYSMYLAQQILRLHNGTNTKKEQKILSKLR